MPCSSIHFATAEISLFSLSEQWSVMYMHSIFFIHSSNDAPLGWFHSLPLFNNAAIDIVKLVSLCYNTCLYFRYISSDRTAASYGKLSFSLLELKSYKAGPKDQVVNMCEIHIGTL